MGANGKIHVMNHQIHQSANLRKIFWNRDLEKKAQEWVNELVKECKFAHNKNSYIGKEGYPVGENIAKNISHMKKTPEHNIDSALKKALKAWWDERLVFDANDFEKDQLKYAF